MRRAATVFASFVGGGLVSLGMIPSLACGVGISNTFEPSPDAEAGTNRGVGVEPTDSGPLSDAERAAADGGSGEAGPDEPEVSATSVAVDSLTADRVRGVDGAIGGDGANDGIFEADVVGPVVALALIRTTADGAPSGSQEWDTWVGTDAIPPALANGFLAGVETFQLAVVEGGILRNDAAGRVSLPAGLHSVRLFASNVGSFAAGNYFRVILQTPDGTLYRGPVVAY